MATKRSNQWLWMVALLALLVAACGDDADDAAADADISDGALDGLSVTVGSKDFDEQLVLGYLSVVALEAAGADVTDEVDLGGTDATRNALESGDIDHYWEYNGTAWISFFGETEPIDDRIEQYEVVRDRDREERGLVWLAPSQFSNTYALAIHADAADELGGPETLSDLGPLIDSDPDAMTLCVETEFVARDDGLPGMEELYGYSFPEGNVTVMDTAVIYSAAGQRDPCNIGEVFTTDPRVAANDLVVLEDDLGFFPLYNASAVFREEAYEDYADELDDIFTPIAEALDDETMLELNDRVSNQGQRPRDVAEDFLQELGLIE
jgi:osmoprotectant transport system substrate-binding protein